MANLPVSLASYKANFGTSDGADPEYALPVGRGYRVRLTLPANFTPTTAWNLSAWTVASFASSDGKDHVLFEIRKDASNYVRVTKTSDSLLKLDGVASATPFSGTLTPTAWSTGSLLFIGVECYPAGNFLFYIGNGASYTTGTAGNGVAFAAGTYLLYGGSNAFHYNNWEGYVNFVLDNEQSANRGTIDYRFNSGNGRHFKDWAYPYFANVVAYLNGTAATGKVDTYQGATVGLGGAGTTGRADVSSGNYLTTADPGAGADGIAAASWGFTTQPDEVTNILGILGRWDGADNQFLVERRTDLGAGSSTGFRVYIANGGADASNFADFVVALTAGLEYKVIVAYAAGTITLRWKVKNATTQQFGSQTSPAASVTGTIPVTLRASALGYKFGGNLKGANQLDGKIDDIRISNTVTLSSSQADADLVNAPDPALWTYWWAFDGDGTDGLAFGLTATWTGTPAYLDDGRHDAGLFERHTKTGAYHFPGVTSQISLGNSAILDGATKASFWGVFTVGPAAANDQPLWGRMDNATNAKRQIDMLIGQSDTKFHFRVSDGSSSPADIHGGTTLVVGSTYAYYVVMDLTQSTDAARYKMGFALLDPTTGIYGAFSSETITNGGSASPAVVNTPVASVIMYFGQTQATGFSRFTGRLDEFRIKVGAAISTATLAAMSVYVAGSASDWDYCWDFNNTPNSYVGTLNGTVSGAIQWYDGRQPAGWTVASSTESDRATSASDLQAGTYGVRVKSAATGAILSVTCGTSAIGDLVLFAGYARQTASSIVMRKDSTGAFSATKDGAIPTQGSMSLCSRMDRADAVGTVTLKAQATVNAAEAYLDSMVAVKFAAVAFDVLQLNGLPASANCMFVYPNYADVSDLYTPTFSGGSWRVALPNSNLQTTITKEVTRSTDATTAYTQFVADLKTTWSIRALLLGGHNLSLNALIRIRASASADGVTSPLYDSDWVLAYPPAYPLNTLQTGHPAYSDRMLTAFDWADARNRYAFTHVLPSNVAARYWSFQFNDTANADGYVELGRLFMGWAYQPTYNFKPGAALGYQTKTARYEADDDTPYYDERTNIRPVNISFDSQDYNEALVFAFDELMRKQGTNRQIGFIWDPTDEENLHRRSMLCTLSQLGNLQHTNTATEDDVTIQLLETP